MVRRTPADWRVLVDEFELCGETLEAFCATRGLNVGTFTVTRYKLRKKSREAEVNRQHPTIKLVPAKLKAQVAREPTGEVELVIDRCLVRFSVGTSVDYLAALATALQRTC